MPSYLVESYVPRSRARDAGKEARRARAAAAELTREGTPVRYLRTTFLPDDETCFHTFEAPSPEAVEELTLRAALGSARIMAAVESTGEKTETENLTYLEPSSKEER